jgi:hypothetical protein
MQLLLLTIHGGSGQQVIHRLINRFGSQFILLIILIAHISNLVPLFLSVATDLLDHALNGGIRIVKLFVHQIIPEGLVLGLQLIIIQNSGLLVVNIQNFLHLHKNLIAFFFQ